MIYAYTDDTISTSITFDFNGHLTFVYPACTDNGWDITVYPDGTIKEDKTNKSYPYLFWEGDYQQSLLESAKSGFVISSTEMITFLEEKLTKIGLNDTEKTDFITFWGPQLTEEKYLVKFVQQENCDQLASYEFTVEPESILRLYVTFEPIYGSIEVPAQELISIERTGFTIVEWGGMILPTSYAQD